jgi:hypothetical protein
VLICYGLPQFMLALPPGAAVYYMVQKYYRHINRHASSWISAALTRAGIPHHTVARQREVCTGLQCNAMQCIRRSLKRLDTITRSPVYGSFAETMKGVLVIRALARTRSFIDAHFVALDNCLRTSYNSMRHVPHSCPALK